VKTLCGCREIRVQTKGKYKLRLTTKAYKLSYNYLKLHHKSSWQIVGQVTSQASAFWRLKEGEKGVVRVCSEASAVVRAVEIFLHSKISQSKVQCSHTLPFKIYFSIPDGKTRNQVDHN
jgi:hypothetical protein